MNTDRNTKRLITGIIAVIVILLGGYFLSKALFPVKEIAPGSESPSGVVAKGDATKHSTDEVIIEAPNAVDVDSNEAVTVIEE